MKPSKETLDLLQGLLVPRGFNRNGLTKDEAELAFAAVIASKEVRELVVAAEDAAAELESFIGMAYPQRQKYEGEMRLYERDMVVVNTARKALTPFAEKEAAHDND